MYTLEDDKETSASLRKRALENQLQGAQQAKSPDPDSAPGPPGRSPKQTIPLDPPPEIEPALPTTPEQPSQSRKKISQPFKKLTTPTNQDTSQKRQALAALTIACIGVFITALDQTVVVTALSSMIKDLQVPITQLDHAAWIVSAYLLGFIVVMPLMGRVSDMYGRRRILLLCFGIFGAGSLLCAIAPMLGEKWNPSFLSALGIDASSPGLVWLIAARLFQAIGGGAVVPVAMAIAGDFYGESRRGLALGIIGAMTEAGGALGPLYGAIIVERLGWQYIFYLNIPLVIALAIGAWFCVPKGNRLHEKIDWFGALLLGLALTCLSLGLAQQGTDLGVTAKGAAPQNNPLALGLALLFLAGFVFIERKVRWPVVDMRLFKRFPFSATSLVSLLIGAALIIALADIPIFMDTVIQGSVLDSGLALLRMTVIIPIGAILGGWLCGRITCRFTAILGLLFTAAGFYLMSRWPVNVGWTQITISTMTAGMGFGLVISPISTTAINAVRATQAGMSSAVVTALRMVGMMLGLAALTSWALAYFKQLAATYPMLPMGASASQFSQWSQGYAHHLVLSAHTVYCSVFFLSMVLCLIALAPAIFLWGNGKTVAELEPEPVEPIIIHATENAAVAPNGMIAGTHVADMPTRSMKKWHWTRKRVFAVAGGIVALLVVAAGLLLYLTPDSDEGDGDVVGDQATTITSGNGKTGAGTNQVQLSLDNTALTSLFVSQLHLQSDALTDLSVSSAPHDGLNLGLNLHIDTSGIHRVMPVEMDSTMSLDNQQNIHLHVYRLLRDGQDAGPQAATNMEVALNQMLLQSMMPALHNQLKGAKILSVHTSDAVQCGKGTEMLTITLKSAAQVVSNDTKPLQLCFKGPLDLNKLLPQK